MDKVKGKVDEMKGSMGGKMTEMKESIGGKMNVMKTNIGGKVDEVKGKIDEFSKDDGLDVFKKQEGLKPYFDSAYGYAVFPKVAKAGIGVGGALGEGSVYINHKDGSEGKIGKSKLIQVSLGFQFGGQVFSEIIFFEDKLDLERFTSGTFEFEADANVVALTASASASASTIGHQKLAKGKNPDENEIGTGSTEYIKGCAVFSVALGGLMYQATIAGQKFTYDQIQPVL